MSGPSKYLVVLSGGQDSTTCLFDAVHQHGATRVGAVSFLYGQRHAREIDSAAFVYELAWRSKPIDVTMDRYRRVIDLGRPFAGSSPLTTSTPLELYANVSEMDAKLKNRVELTFVPGRNAAFLAIACGIAAAEGYDAVVTGVNGADNANYPDCTPEFIEAMENTMRLATRSNVAIYTPLQGMTKAAIVSKARRIPSCWEALAFTTTDYAGAYPPGNNHASVLREAGFEEAGLEDPLRERAKAEGLL